MKSLRQEIQHSHSKEKKCVVLSNCFQKKNIENKHEKAVFKIGIKFCGYSMALLLTYILNTITGK